MAELRQSLNALVVRPPALPSPVELVIARGERLRMRRRMLRGSLGVAVLAIAGGLGVGVAMQGSDSNVVLATAGPRSAGYVAEEPGGYVGTGTWQMTITRDGQVIELSSTASDTCGPTGVILPGDEVRGSISGPGSTLRVGESFACPD